MAEVERRVQRCFSELPTERGSEPFVRLRLTIEATGRVRSVSPFDPQNHPEYQLAPTLSRCLANDVQHWKIPSGRAECADYAPWLALVPLNVLMAVAHHKLDVPPDVQKSKWWAVCKFPEGFELIPVDVAVNETGGDSCLAENARSIVAMGCREPVFLVRHLRGAAQRRLTTASVAPAPEGGSGGSMTFAGRTWGIQIDGDDVFLTTQETRQWLFRTSAVRVDIAWAGDLDGDGRLDFALEATEEGGHILLFESRAAREGEVVHLVSRGLIPGC